MEVFIPSPYKVQSEGKEKKVLRKIPECFIRPRDKQRENFFTEDATFRR